ncbi:hypothetical protein QTP88_002241 [Uroleucon formosanum]
MSGYKKGNKKNKQFLLEVGSSLNQIKINSFSVLKQQFWTEGKCIGKKKAMLSKCPGEIQNDESSIYVEDTNGKIIIKSKLNFGLIYTKNILIHYARSTRG